MNIAAGGLILLLHFCSRIACCNRARIFPRLTAFQQLRRILILFSAITLADFRICADQQGSCFCRAFPTIQHLDVFSLLFTLNPLHFIPRYPIFSRHRYSGDSVACSGRRPACHGAGRLARHCRKNMLFDLRTSCEVAKRRRPGRG